jgi:hypothetical protein
LESIGARHEDVCEDHIRPAGPRGHQCVVSSADTHHVEAGEAEVQVRELELDRIVVDDQQTTAASDRPIRGLPRQIGTNRGHEVHRIGGLEEACCKVGRVSIQVVNRAQEAGQRQNRDIVTAGEAA